MRNQTLKSLAALAVGLFLAAGAALGSTPAIANAKSPTPSEAQLPHLRLSLISATHGAVPGSTLHVALRQTIAPGWHTYWLNPGDAGQPTQIIWTLPGGVHAESPIWPTPRRLPEASLMTYGYQGEVVTPVALRLPGSLQPGATLPLSAHVDLLVCRDSCAPESADLSLSLPIAAASTPKARWSDAIASALAAAPRAGDVQGSASLRDGMLALNFTGPALRGLAGQDAYFFPSDSATLDHAAPQRVAWDKDRVVLSVKAASDLGRQLSRPIRGLLSVGGQAFNVSATPIAPPVAQPVRAKGTAIGIGAIAGALAMGLLGGLVLNLMPCVFPILAMKAAALARGAGESPGAARGHGLAFLAGSVSTFLCLGGLLIALRAAGQAAGWGFQLQSPRMTAALTLLMLAVALNMSGVFEIGLGAQRLAGRGSQASGVLGAFATGVLAVIVAAPCTAPFMAAATGYALTASPPLALLVFAAIGVGLGFPFAALCLSPRLTAHLPRPGAWMEHLRHGLAFPMYGAAAWLAWVFVQQSGPGGLGFLFSAGVVLAFALQALGGVQKRGAEGSPTPIGAVVAAGGVLAAGLLAFLAAEGAVDTDRALAAEPYSAQRLSELRAQGRQVFVNFTAAWCVTCKVNERMALSRPEVAAALARTHTAYLVGDWTRRDGAVTRSLTEQGRAGVPLYLVYRPKDPAPVVLPQLLTARAVTGALAAR